MPRRLLIFSPPMPMLAADLPPPFAGSMPYCAAAIRRQPPLTPDAALSADTLIIADIFRLAPPHYCRRCHAMRR
jgi:hypothetical protein